MTNKTPVLAVDVVLLTIRDHTLHVLLVRRGVSPFAGRWALPGGFVEPDEGLDDAAQRELVEETGIVSPAHLEQLKTYGDPDRDPRSRVVSVAYIALVPDLPAATGGSDASEARYVPVADAPPLPFDHDTILGDAVERARSKLEYTSLATAFCPPEFTVAQLRRVYETVWGVRLDPRNFHRKVTGAKGFLAATGATTNVDGGRPAALFRRGPAALLHPALLRTDA
ncbi:NUDIX hydrolase [Pedococcus sp. P5_B7]